MLEKLQMDRYETTVTIVESKKVQVTKYDNDNGDFYRIIAEHFQPTTTVSECKAEIAKFILKHKRQFHMFLPVATRWTTNALKDLEQDVQSSRNLAPSPREIYAAVELLRREIHLIKFSGDTKDDTGFYKFSVTVFSPVLKTKFSSGGNEGEENDQHKNPLLLLFVRNADGKLRFAELAGDSSATYNALPLPVDTHKLCCVSRYRNDFSTLLKPLSFQSQEDGSHDFYKTLSIVFYGTDMYRDRVKEMICIFEEDPDHVDMTVSFLDSSDNSNKSDVAKEHVTRIRSETELPKELEIFAAASIFNVPIFLDAIGNGEHWNLYMPLTGAFGNVFSCHVLLRREGCKFDLVVNNPGLCLCQQERPFVRGKLGIFNDQIYEKIREILGMLRKTSFTLSCPLHSLYGLRIPVHVIITLLLNVE